MGLVKTSKAGFV
jgi:predicted lipoprotein